jgi:uncharacterized protein YndB with AHSA1/START domain
MANPLELLPLKTNGFQFIHEIAIHASPKKSWSALSDIGNWFGFDPDRSKWARHKLDFKVGAQWIVEFPSGASALFGTVTYMEPGKLVRIYGQFGLTHLPVVNTVIFEIQERDGGNSTLLRVCFRSSGFMTDDVEKRINEVWGKLLPNIKALAEK